MSDRHRQRCRPVLVRPERLSGPPLWALVEVDIFDGSSYLKITFFNQGWRAKQLSVGTEPTIFGR